MWIRNTSSLFFLTLVLIIQLTFFPRKALCSADFSDEVRLRKTILDNYDKHARPVQSHHDTTVVTLYFLFAGLEINELKNELTLHMETVIDWMDEHIFWNPLNFGNLSYLTFPPSDLWHPDITVMNSLDNENAMNPFGTIVPVMLLWAYNDSFVWWVPHTRVKANCAFDFRLWPYDKQSCQVIFSSMMYHFGEIDLYVAENRSKLVIEELQEGYPENREWRLVDSSVERVVRIVYCCPEVPRVEIIITVDIERKSSGHTAAITVVGLGIAAAVLISFWLDPFAQERIPLTLLLLLINSIYLQYLHKVIPNNGLTVPLSMAFFRDSLIMIVFSVAWTVNVRYIASRKSSTPISLPSFLQAFLDSYAATMLCLNPRPQSKGEAQRKFKENCEGENGDVSELVGDDAVSAQDSWEWMARLLDRILFFVYLITYVVFSLEFL